ncbi:hypothetical protein JCM8097_008632 [Rhodosporidiobolus ruineniae]
MPSITVHWLNNSAAQRILWVLEELNLEYNIVRYERQPGTYYAPPELKNVHPLGKGPVIEITDGDDTFVMAESGAIIDFLVERYGRGELSVLAEAPAKKRAEYLYWLHFTAGSGTTSSTLATLFALLPKQSPWYIRPLVSSICGGVMSAFVMPRLKDTYDFIDSSLEGTDYICGDKFNGADINLVILADVLEVVFLTTSLSPLNYPNIQRWHSALRERPAYKAAEEKGDQLDFTKMI